MISKEIFKNNDIIKKNIKIETIKKCRKIIITGNVGVGKTTIINNLCEKLQLLKKSYVVVPEYIDVLIDAKEKLEKYLNGVISVYDFQNYVINYYKDYLLKQNINENTTIIFERCVDDAVAVFSRIYYLNRKLSIMEFTKLFSTAVEIDTTFNIPSMFVYDNKNIEILHLKTITINETVNNIITKINNNNDIIVFLYNDINECYRRIILRNRNGENIYTQKTIEVFNNRYEEIYNIMKQNKRIPFINLM